MSIRTVLHFLAAAHFWFGCLYDWHYVKVPSSVHQMGESFGKSGKLKFLTFWDAVSISLYIFLIDTDPAVFSMYSAGYITKLILSAFAVVRQQSLNLFLRIGPYGFPSLSQFCF